MEEMDFATASKEAVEHVHDGSAALLDVRKDDEWAAGHAPQAMHWELARLEQGEMPDLPKEKPVYVHCAAGGRAGKARELLLANGWTSVVNIGGLKDWQAAGGEVTTE